VPSFTSDFGLEGFNPRNHNWILLDEFNILETNEDFWKRMVAGEEVQINRKGRPAYQHTFNIPIAMSSNYPPPNFIGFNERVVIVKADKGEFSQTFIIF
jgi:phage/plasmid-associated DNA primase